MASNAGAVSKVELSAVTSTPHEQVTFDWRVENFKGLVESALAKGKTNEDAQRAVVVARLPFYPKVSLFPPETPEVLLCWKLRLVHQKRGDKMKVHLVLVRETPPSEKDFAVQLYGSICAHVFKDKNFSQGGNVFYWSPKVMNFTRDKSWGWMLFGVRSLSERVDSQGSLNLRVMAELYVHTDGDAEILPQEKSSNNNVTCESEMESRKVRRGVLLDQVASLYGDEVTSDVIVSVVDPENTEIEIGKFDCHSAILSGRSSVLRKMLEESFETKDGKVILKLEEEVTLEVIDLFFRFIYSGRLGEEKIGKDGLPVWVSSLPQLLQLARKYDMKDLEELCDLNLFRGAVSGAKTAEILGLAKRLNLKRTLDKFRAEFQKDKDWMLITFSNLSR